MPSFILRQTLTKDSDCKGFSITDSSGTYNAVTNPTGYGAPNAVLAEATASRVLVTKFNTSTTYTITTTASLPSSAAAITNVNIGLSTADTIPDGIYHSRYEVDFTNAITGVNTGTKTFTISGDRTGLYVAGKSITVTASTANDGTYTIVSSTFSSGSTSIVVSQTITSAVANGNINITSYSSIYTMFFCSGQSCLNEKLQLINIDGCTDCYDAKLKMAAKVNVFMLVGQYAASCAKPNRAQAILDYLSDLCDLESCTSC